MKVVIDTSVWVSGLLWGGVPDRILSLAQTQQISIFASEAMLNELGTTLGKNKLKLRLESLSLTVESLMLLVRQLVQVCPTVSLSVPQWRDPNDIIILEAAVGATADVIVTGDQDF